MGTVISHPDLLFGDHRDIFVNACILTAYILSLPVAIMRTSEEHDYDRPPGFYTATILFIIIGCLLHIATCVKFKSELDEKTRRSDILYLISCAIILTGAIMLITFGGVYANNHCNTLSAEDSLVSDNYATCWWNAFSSFLAQFLMVLYLIALIFTNRYSEQFGWDRCCHVVKKVMTNVYFRAGILLAANCFVVTELLTFPEIYDESNVNYRNWVYFNTAFILVTVITAALNVCNVINWEKLGYFAVLTLWFVVSLASFAAGCLTYRMIELTWEGGAAHFGENIFWTFCNVWLFSESLHGLRDKESEFGDPKYEPIAQKL